MYAYLIFDLMYIHIYFDGSVLSGRCAKDSGYKPSHKKSHHYGVDDVTIDSWMPSLPRPKIKPGLFSQHDEVIEMSENNHLHGDQMVTILLELFCNLCIRKPQQAAEDFSLSSLEFYKIPLS